MANVTSKLNCSIYGTNDANQNIVVNRAFSASVIHNYNGISQFGSLVGGAIPFQLVSVPQNMIILYFKNTTGSNGPAILLECTISGGPAAGAKYVLLPGAVFVLFNPVAGSLVDGIGWSIIGAQASTPSGTATFEYYFGAI